MVSFSLEGRIMSLGIHVMRRLIFEAEHEQFRDSVRAFMLAEIAPHADRWREVGIVDREVYAKAGQAGLLCTWADEKYGGAGVDDFRFEQIIARREYSPRRYRLLHNLHSNLVAPYIAKLGNDEHSGID